MQGWQGVPRFKSVGLSFTGQFTIKAGESNSKGLKSTERIIIVQSEHIFCYTTKLHHNVVSWGEKDSETNNFTVKQRKKKTKPTTNKNPHIWQSQIYAVGVSIHPFSPAWPQNLFSRVTVILEITFILRTKAQTTLLLGWKCCINPFPSLEEACICPLFCCSYGQQSLYPLQKKGGLI